MFSGKLSRMLSGKLFGNFSGKFSGKLSTKAHTTVSASNLKYHTGQLLEYLRLCPLLKGGASTLSTVISKCLRSELPPFLYASVFETDNSTLKRKPPSASMLQRYQFVLDLALLDVQRKRSRKLNAPDPKRRPVRWPLHDSSPLCGFDWLWSQFAEVDQAMLIDLFEAVEDLTNLINSFVAQQAEAAEADDRDQIDEFSNFTATKFKDVDGMRPLEERGPRLKLIRCAIREHVNPPAALGSGHRGLHDKVSAELHKYYFQTDKDVALEDVCKMYRC